MEDALKEMKVWIGIGTILLGIAINLAVPVVVDYVINFLPEQLKVLENFKVYFLPLAYFVANAVFLRYVFSRNCEERPVEDVEKLKDRISQLERENTVLNALVEKQQRRIEELESKQE
ncbi:hypothetical protein [Persephonella sp.]